MSRKQNKETINWSDIKRKKKKHKEMRENNTNYFLEWQNKTKSNTADFKPYLKADEKKKGRQKGTITKCIFDIGQLLKAFQPYFHSYH
jgi:hypothetical protein